MSAASLERLTFTAECLRLEWAGGVVDEFSGVWLRDNEPRNRDPHSGQRLIDIADLPAQASIAVASRLPQAVRVEWQDAAPATEFDLDWLAAHGAAAPPAPERLRTPWLHGGTLDARRDFAWTDAAAFANVPKHRLDWMTRLLRSGIAFLGNVPATEDALLEAMRPIGRVCETNYGLAFDVRAVAQPENLAYSDLGLGLHTDNPYRDPVPGFQALHALRAAPDGGISLFADGHALVNHLRTVDPAGFEVLAHTPVPFHYRSSNSELYAERPMIQLQCDGEIAAIHYNNRSMAPLRSTAPAAARFYAAYRKLAELLREPRFQLKIRLGDGDLVVFDNQRILHGRTAFVSARHARHLRGCYLTRDSVYSETALLRRST